VQTKLPSPVKVQLVPSPSGRSVELSEQVVAPPPEFVQVKRRPEGTLQVLTPPGLPTQVSVSPPRQPSQVVVPSPLPTQKTSKARAGTGATGGRAASSRMAGQALARAIREPYGRMSFCRR